MLKPNIIHKIMKLLVMVLPLFRCEAFFPSILNGITNLINPSPNFFKKVVSASKNIIEADRIIPEASQGYGEEIFSAKTALKLFPWPGEPQPCLTSGNCVVKPLGDVLPERELKINQMRNLRYCENLRIPG